MQKYEKRHQVAAWAVMCLILAPTVYWLVLFGSQVKFWLRHGEWIELPAYLLFFDRGVQDGPAGLVPAIFPSPKFLDTPGWVGARKIGVWLLEWPIGWYLVGLTLLLVWITAQVAKDEARR